jgi:hypothetical protein
VSAPLTGVLREDLQRFTAVQLRARDRSRHTARHGHVRTDAHAPGRASDRLTFGPSDLLTFGPSDLLTLYS